MEGMKDKMKNIRNVKPWHKKPHGIEEASIPTKKQKRLPFPRYPLVPTIPPSEDEASCVRHMKLLQLEYQKASPDKYITSSLMDRTYPFRRKDMLQQPKPIQQILKEYPPLKKIEQVASYVLCSIFHTYIHAYTYIYIHTYYTYIHAYTYIHYIHTYCNFHVKIIHVINIYFD